MKNILIIGAGQLGSRHLQALALLKEPANIFVIDISETSLEIAKERFIQVAPSFNGTVVYKTSLKNVEANIDLAIIASNSNVRYQILEELLTSKKVKYLILEKFLFTRITDYKKANELVKQAGVKAWVNLPRRVIPFYINLRNKLTLPVQMNVHGSIWGLGSNGVHMLDLFAFLTGATNVTESLCLLDMPLLESKRPGFIEFSGTIAFHADNGSVLNLTSYKDGNAPFIIEISSPKATYYINESPVTNVKMITEDSNWELQMETFKFPFQSELTNVIAESLFENSDCGLTSFSESAHLHQIYLEALLRFINKPAQTHITECLVT